MKNPNQERLRRMMKQYHRNNESHWSGGFYFPYTYQPLKKLSWCDDVGFILNDRRVMVWWQHPRMKYSSAIANMAWKEAGDPPIQASDMFTPCEKTLKKVGRSRKKVSSYVSLSIPDSLQEYYAKHDAIKFRMSAEGIDLVVRPSMSVTRLAWCTSIELCMPIDVHNIDDARALALLARRLIKGETTLANEFPGYEYGRTAWLDEAETRSQDSLQRSDLD